jgi:coenzyme F420 biosynthesis associated uncharacterized protein
MNLVDWDFAVTVGSRIAGPGPEVTSDDAAAAVVELREGAARSTPLVREFTGLQAGEGTAPVLVVDRPGWVQANADGFAKILTPIVDKLAEKKGGAPSGLSATIGSRVTGAEVGLMLGFLGTKVLGQFDPFFAAHGRLLLVAPNIVHVEREINAHPHDFRLWVCLHEETHRVQFTANPWLGEHLLGEMNKVADSIDPGAVMDGLRRATEVVRGGGGSVLDLVSTPEQKEILDRVTGVMSLLEGHADVVMDGVGPAVIPSVAQIRKKFNQRRKGVGTIDKMLRRLLGLDAKMAQYRDGAVFVRHVVDKTGMEEFNAVWSGPEALPSKAEITDPDTWIARVL